MKEYRIILAEDHVLFRRLVCQELNNAEGLKVVSQDIRFIKTGGRTKNLLY